jgi:hypothetical protein
VIFVRSIRRQAPTKSFDISGRPPQLPDPAQLWKPDASEVDAWLAAARVAASQYPA